MLLTEKILCLKIQYEMELSKFVWRSAFTIRCTRSSKQLKPILKTSAVVTLPHLVRDGEIENPSRTRALRTKPALEKWKYTLSSPSATRSRCTLTIIYKHSQQKGIDKKSHSALWEKGQAENGMKEERENVLSVDLWSVQEPSFRSALFCWFIQLLLSLSLSLAHPRSERREKVRAKRGADDASHLDQMRSSLLSLHAALVTEFKCLPVAIITFSLFHPCICLSLSLSFFLAKATTRETWSMRKPFAKETAHSQISPSFHPAAHSAMANTPNCFIAHAFVAFNANLAQ